MNNEKKAWRRGFYFGWSSSLFGMLLYIVLNHFGFLP